MGDTALSRGHTADALLTLIRREGRIAPEDTQYTDAALLAEADAIMLNHVVPLLSRAREDYYVRSEDTSLDGAGEYTIPSRAVGSTVRSVWIVTSGGDEYELDPRPITDKPLFGTSTVEQPECYAIQDDRIVLLPSDNGTGTLRIYYQYRPNNLVLLAEAARVTAAPSSGSVDVAAVPVAFDTSDTFDFVRGYSPCPLLGIEKTSSDVSGPMVFDADDVPSRLGIGDYVCLAGQTPIPQIPGELFAPLALGVVAKVERDIGRPDAGPHMEEFLQTLGQVVGMMRPRQKGRSRHIVSHTSPLRRRFFRGAWPTGAA